MISHIEHLAVCVLLQVFLCCVGHPHSSWSPEWTGPTASITFILWTLSRGKGSRNTTARKLNLFLPAHTVCFSQPNEYLFFSLPAFSLPLRYLQSMVVAAYPPHPQRPLLTWSTSQSVLTAPPGPPPPLVQLQTRLTQNTAPTPQCPV